MDLHAAQTSAAAGLEALERVYRGIPIDLRVDIGSVDFCGLQVAWRRLGDLAVYSFFLPWRGYMEKTGQIPYPCELGCVIPPTRAFVQGTALRHGTHKRIKAL